MNCPDEQIEVLFSITVMLLFIYEADLNLTTPSSPVSHDSVQAVKSCSDVPEGPE